MKKHHCWIIVGLLLGLTGCDTADDDDSTPEEEPAGCENFSLQNILYDFVIDDPDDLLGLGVTQTDDEFWTDYAQEFADDGNYAVLYLALGLTVASHGPDGNNQQLVMEMRDEEGAVMITVTFNYFLPMGKTIPVATEQNIVWQYTWNFVSEPRTAPLFFDEDGVLLFYGEPGANGLAYNNDPYVEEDPNPTANPLFAEVRTIDEGCSPINYLDCGNQINLMMEFTTWDGQEIELWPGETGTFLFGEEGAEQEYELINVWSYDWRDVTTCEGPQYERNYAFFVMLSS